MNSLFNYEFKNPELMKQALTHRSLREETGVMNERLEFLGDAVIELMVSDWLYNAFPKAEEGRLTRMRSALVNTGHLAQLAQDHGLLDLLRKGTSLNQISSKIQASTFEAVVGAIYKDAGFEKTCEVFESVFSASINQGKEFVEDFKTHLQEFSQAQFSITPTYKIVSAEGPEHAKTFTAAVFLADVEKGIGVGESKKSAEQAAARVALTNLKEQADV